MSLDPSHNDGLEVFTNQKLWEHAHPDETQMASFIQYLSKTYKTQIRDYQTLHRWSCDNISDFWEAVWHFTGIKASRAFSSVVDESKPMFPRPTFFQGAALNFAENLLYPICEPHKDSLALLCATEMTRETLTWHQLRESVASCQSSMQAVGIGQNDVVAGYVGNHAKAVIYMLASTSLGAMWTAISPDSGVSMVLDRLTQVEPKLLVADASQEYNGKQHNVLPKVQDVAQHLPHLKALVILSNDSSLTANKEIKLSSGTVYDESDFTKLPRKPRSVIGFEQFPADHPIYILYSSGTWQSARMSSTLDLSCHQTS